MNYLYGHNNIPNLCMAPVAVVISVVEGIALVIQRSKVSQHNCANIGA